MSHRFDVRPGRLAGPIFASGLVILLGALGVAITVAAGGGDAWITCAVFVGIIFATPLLGLLFRANPGNLLANRFGWMTVRNPNDESDYLPRAMRTRRRHFGTNQPPTVEEIREAKENLNNWVPAGNSQKKQPR
ncbi:MAG TPA: hypothetical protein VNQ76_09950 [Planctomicrobium sp.]|nr:hypothetical protein [Planctomicrobium sp.]